MLSPVRVTVFVFGPAGIAAHTRNERFPSKPVAFAQLMAKYKSVPPASVPPVALITGARLSKGAPGAPADTPAGTQNATIASTTAVPSVAGAAVSVTPNSTWPLLSTTVPINGRGR